MDEVPPFASFGERLEWWRKKRGYKRQGALSAEISIQQGSLSELESGKSKAPSAEVLLRLCDTLQLRPKYLLLGEGAPESQHFQELTGPEAQLVMIFRQLPTDAARDALLIDANDRLTRALAKSSPGSLQAARGVLNVSPSAKVKRSG